MRSGLATSTALAIAVGLLAAGCATQQAANGTGSSTSSAAVDVPKDLTMINGQVPPGKPSRVPSSVTLVSAKNSLGQDVFVFRDTRPAGTRSAIHIHPSGGTTCMLSGEMTLFMEGAAPQRAETGQCYYMPPNVPMSGANTGSTDAVLLDYFTVPTGQPVWAVVEKGMYHLQENFDGGNSAQPSSDSM